MKSLIRNLIFGIALSVASIGLYRGDAYSQWVQASGIGNTIVSALGSSSLGMVAGGGFSKPDSVWLSTNNGQTWTLLSSNVPIQVSTAGVIGTTAIVGSSSSSGFYYSADFGHTWNPDNTGIPAQAFTTSMLTVGSTVFAGTGAGVYQQSQPGTAWTPDTVGMSLNGNGMSVTDMTAIGNTLFAIVPFVGVYRSTDMGAHWSLLASSSASLGLAARLASSGNTLYALITNGATYDVYASTDNGNTWTKMTSTSLNLANPQYFTASNNTLVIASDSGVSFSNNGGASWRQVNQGLASSSSSGSWVTTAAISGNNLVVGTFGKGAWYRPLSQLASVNSDRANGALQASLTSNPAATTTELTFTLKNSSSVHIALIDALGRN